MPPAIMFCPFRAAPSRSFLCCSLRTSFYLVTCHSSPVTAFISREQHGDVVNVIAAHERALGIIVEHDGKDEALARRARDISGERGDGRKRARLGAHVARRG